MTEYLDRAALVLITYHKAQLALVIVLGNHAIGMETVIQSLPVLIGSQRMSRLAIKRPLYICHGNSSCVTIKATQVSLKLNRHFTYTLHAERSAEKGFRRRSIIHVMYGDATSATSGSRLRRFITLART